MPADPRAALLKSVERRVAIRQPVDMRDFPALLDAALEHQKRADAEIVRQLTRVDDRLEAGYECGWNAACAAAVAAILRGAPEDKQ